MRRWIVFTVLLAVGVLSLVVTANQQQGEMVVEVEQLEDNLFVLRGGGGNSAAFVTSDGVVLVDTKLAGWGQPLLDKIGDLTSNPVTTIINTHSHFDHVSGNPEFPGTVDIVAHENAQPFMEDMQPVSGLSFPVNNVFDASDGQGLPTRTFADRISLGSGPDQVDLYYFGRGHTGGDTWVVFPALRTMHAGDMFPGKQVPIMDANNGGSGVDFPQTLNKSYQTITEIDTIITGHSTQMTRDDLREYAEFAGDLVDAAREAKAAGRSAEDFANSWEIPATYSGYGKGPALGAYVQVIYDELP